MSVKNISTLLKFKDGILTNAFRNISILPKMLLTIPASNYEGAGRSYLEIHPVCLNIKVLTLRSRSGTV